MPGGDRTGPVGYGAMTGRRMGYCSGNPGPGYEYSGPGPGYGRGRGSGLGRGRGWRRFGRFGGHFVPYAPLYAPWERAQTAPEKEIDQLKEESEFLKDELNRIERRISEIEGEKE